VLRVSIGELFESPEDKSGNAKSPLRLLAGRDALRVLTAFSRISDLRLRRAIAQLVETAANQPTAIASISRPDATPRGGRRRKV
jgi:hypothetical protein